MVKSKRIQERDKGIDFSRFYSPKEALLLIKERASAKFDETVEGIFECSVDPRKGDQNIRGIVDLPCGTGKEKRVAVVADGNFLKEAEEAGADVFGEEDLIQKIQDGFLDFDVCIAVPHMMLKLSKLGKILGPKGLMPNPKEGTVTSDIRSAVKAAKTGRVSFRPDKEGIVHSVLGKASFSVDDLADNFHAMLEALFKAKPQSLKGDLVKRIFLSSTMGFALPLVSIREKNVDFLKK